MRPFRRCLSFDDLMIILLKASEDEIFIFLCKLFLKSVVSEEKENHCRLLCKHPRLKAADIFYSKCTVLRKQTFSDDGFVLQTNVLSIAKTLILGKDLLISSGYFT